MFSLFWTNKTKIEFFNIINMIMYMYISTVSYSTIQVNSVFPCFVAVVLFGEPNQWDSKLQLIVDVLVSNGMPTQPPQEVPSTHLPVLACNMDLFWMSEVPLPR